MMNTKFSLIGYGIAIVAIGMAVALQKEAPSNATAVIPENSPSAEWAVAFEELHRLDSEIAQLENQMQTLDSLTRDSTDSKALEKSPEDRAYQAARRNYLESNPSMLATLEQFEKSQTAEANIKQKNTQPDTSYLRKGLLEGSYRPALAKIGVSSFRQDQIINDVLALSEKRKELSDQLARGEISKEDLRRMATDLSEDNIVKLALTEAEYSAFKQAKLEVQIDGERQNFLRDLSRSSPTLSQETLTLATETFMKFRPQPTSSSGNYSEDKVVQLGKTMDELHSKLSAEDYHEVEIYLKSQQAISMQVGDLIRNISKQAQQQ